VKAEPKYDLRSARVAVPADRAPSSSATTGVHWPRILYTGVHRQVAREVSSRAGIRKGSTMKRSSAARIRLGVCLSAVLLLAVGSLRAQTRFIRGDTDGNGQLEMSDAIRVLGYLFLHTPDALDCLEAANANAGEGLDISDGVYILSYLYLDGKAPPMPYPSCGLDPLGTPLGCERHGACTSMVDLELVYIQPGSFDMGSNEYSWEQPMHRVTISKGFYLSRTEVTQCQYERVMGVNPSWFNGSHDGYYFGTDLTRPVEQVSWFDATEFCTRLSAAEGVTYRLPTEAEWEYACRAGTTTAFSFGDVGGCAWWICNPCPEADPYLWWCANALDPVSGWWTPKSVATKLPNSWGFHDMHGNVWEWCEDWWGSYSYSVVTDPTGPSSGDSRVLRGGCFDGSFDLWYSRSAGRNYSDPGFRRYGIGFRVVLVSGLPGE
jgi:formylglycine-generating enzyme required for sulfatase activity